MAVSTYGGVTATMNPLVGNSPASIPTNNAMPLFAKWVEEYEKKQFPLTSLFRARKEPFDQVKISVGQSYNPFITTAIKATTANNSANVDVDDTSLFREGDVIEIIPYYVAGDTTSGLNYYAREVAVVNSITDSDTLVLYRDSDRTSTGSWPVHDIDSYVRVISRAVAYNQAFTQAPTYRGDFIYTHPQRIEGKIVADIAGINTPDFESSNHFERLIKNETINMKWYREEAFSSGWRMTGDAVTSNDGADAKPHQMGGVYWWLNQNSANVTDLANSQLDIYDIVDLLRGVWKNHRKGPATTVLAGPDTIEIFDQLINPYREATMSDTDVTLMTKVVSTRWGKIQIVPTMHFPEGNVAFIDPADWEYGPYKGCDWSIVRREPSETDKPTREWAMWGDFSLICTDLQRQSLITGIDTRLANYSGRVFLT